MNWHLIIGTLVILAVWWVASMAEDADDTAMRAAQPLDIADPRVTSWVEEVND